MQLSGFSPLICEETISGADSKAYSEYYFQLLEGMKLAGK